jgi:hypothetical protein
MKENHKLTAKHMAILAVVDVMRADIANGVEYLREHPTTHVELPERTAKAFERHLHLILDGLNNRLPEWARR